MEAEYLRDFVCCDLKLDTMHDLLRHYETVHTGTTVQGNRNGNGVRMPHRLSVSSRPSISMGSGARNHRVIRIKAKWASANKTG